MIGGGKSINAWPAFSDMAFMLAINCLVVAGAIAIRAREQQAENERRAAEVKQAEAAVAAAQEDVKREQSKNQVYIDRLRKLGVNPDEVNECGLATPVVRTMEQCLRERSVRVERRGCSLSIDAAIRFSRHSAQLSEEVLEQARSIAECVILGAEAVDDSARSGSVGSVSLDAISIEGHADSCGYRDWGAVQRGGLDLTIERAKSVYQIVFDKVRDEAARFDDRKRLRVLSRVAVRSFGPYRPLRTSSCNCAVPGSCDADRRVEIVVQGSLGSGTANWKPVALLPFMERGENSLQGSIP